MLMLNKASVNIKLLLNQQIVNGMLRKSLLLCARFRERSVKCFWFKGLQRGRILFGLISDHKII